ncbi:MgtC/SapB family protein [Verticiella sediminum]|uniref:Protein MgtC n=1 Tax=Verticiella sediminum TaxID=1247510 RepID=A0A556AX00_9BURK|nr:MgtC/SapB family protein [Verticiella sediminum]TSH96915.1 MgtC/SapB family protein [Verticiella sediminum]
MEELGTQIWHTVQSEFADLPSAVELTRIITRLTVAMLLGGLLGYEREAHGKSAGLRTHMLVALGAAMFVLVPTEAGMSLDDASRVIQGAITGIGFLGAGAILKLTGDGRVHGLTTAAGIWLTASVGIAAGLGREGTAVVATVFALFILAALKRLNISQPEDDARQNGDRTAPLGASRPSRTDIEANHPDDEGVSRS